MQKGDPEWLGAFDELRHRARKNGFTLRRVSGPEGAEFRLIHAGTAAVAYASTDVENIRGWLGCDPEQRGPYNASTAA